MLVCGLCQYQRRCSICGLVPNPQMLNRDFMLLKEKEKEGKISQLERFIQEMCRFQKVPFCADGKCLMLKRDL